MIWTEEFIESPKTRQKITCKPHYLFKEAWDIWNQLVPSGELGSQPHVSTQLQKFHLMQNDRVADSGKFYQDKQWEPYSDDPMLC